MCRQSCALPWPGGHHRIVERKGRRSGRGRRRVRTITRCASSKANNNIAEWVMSAFQGQAESLSCLDTLFPSYLVSPHSLSFLDTSRPRRCVSFCKYTNRYVGLSVRGSKSRSLHNPCLSLSRAPSPSELFTLNLAANQRAGFLLEFVS